MLRLRRVVIAAFLACVLAAPALPQATATPPELKVAFIGDQGLGQDPEEVLRLIAAEGAEAVFIQGDFDYADDPAAWEAMLDATLGPDFPVIALVGNHDEAEWYGAGGYQDRLAKRMQRLGLSWLGELGVQATLHYKGLFVVQTAPNVFDDGYDHAAFIRSSLAADASIWSISAWHKLMSDMQVGGKGDETGWEVYEETRRGGAIIATAHEHSYSRTHLMSSMENQTVASTAQPLVLAADDPSTSADEGRTFAFVSGLGGNSIRDQERTGDWWASVYTATQDASNGALFAVFHVNGDPRLAHFYFKDVTGKVVDDFLVRSTLDPAEEPPPGEDLSDQYPFVEASTGTANTSFLNVDTSSGRMCVAGQVRGSDEAANVTFSYESLGSIDKATDERVRGVFVSVSLTLDVTGGASPAYRQTVQAECKLKASLLKAGSQAKAGLRCDLGDHYSAFAGLTPEQVTNIDNAFAHQKRAKATSKNGRLKVSHVGVPSSGRVPVSCVLPN